MQIDQARLLMLQRGVDDGHGRQQGRAEAEIAMIKVVAPNMACQVIDWAIQVHGGAGVCRRLPARLAATRRRARCASPTAPTRCIATRSPSSSSAASSRAEGRACSSKARWRWSPVRGVASAGRCAVNSSGAVRRESSWPTSTATSRRQYCRRARRDRPAMRRRRCGGRRSDGAAGGAALRARGRARLERRFRRAGARPRRRAVGARRRVAAHVGRARHVPRARLPGRCCRGCWRAARAAW